MNQPSLFSFAILGLVFLLTACPPRDDPAKDDAGKPADGDSGPGDGDPGAKPGAPAAAGDGDGDPAPTCEAELERVKAELAECQAPK